MQARAGNSDRLGSKPVETAEVKRVGGRSKMRAQVATRRSSGLKAKKGSDIERKSDITDLLLIIMSFWRSYTSLKNAFFEMIG